MSQVAILMGSVSDWPIMKKTAEVLDDLEITYEAKVYSAHRTPQETVDYVKESESKGTEVFITGAGMSAALCGVVAAHTTRPVIGVPIASGALKGQDALYAVSMMPPGIPVACMAIDGGKNAGLMAASILSIVDNCIKERLLSYRKDMKDKVLATELK